MSVYIHNYFNLFSKESHFPLSLKFNKNIKTKRKSKQKKEERERKMKQHRHYKQTSSHNSPDVPLTLCLFLVSVVTIAFLPLEPPSNISTPFKPLFSLLFTSIITSYFRICKFPSSFF